MKRKYIRIIAPAICLFCMSNQVYAAPEPGQVTEAILEVESSAEETVENPTIEEEKPAEESAETTIPEAPESEDTSVETKGNEGIEKETTTTESGNETETVDDGMITTLPSDNGPDEEGYVTMTVTTADDVVLPVEITMKNKGDTTTMTVSYQEQQIRIKPGNYTITKVVDGNKKKLDKGATLNVPEENGAIYLDFKKPKEEKDHLFLDFFFSNIIFIPIGVVLCGIFAYFKNRN